MGFIPKDARWYLADVVLEHTIGGDSRNVVHVNTHLIEADSPDRAYEKAVTLGRAAEFDYTNTDSEQVRVAFRGLRELNVVHEELKDGAESSYREYTAVPESRLQEWARAKQDLGVFAPIRDKLDVPNYFPQSISEELERAGLGREDTDGNAQGGEA
jgi:hypothetical protein